MQRAIVIRDASLELGSYAVGGAVVLNRASHEMLGWAIGATPVRCHCEIEAKRIEDRLTELGIDYRRWGDWAVADHGS